MLTSKHISEVAEEIREDLQFRIPEDEAKNLFEGAENMRMEFMFNEEVRNIAFTAIKDVFPAHWQEWAVNVVNDPDTDPVFIITVMEANVYFGIRKQEELAEKLMAKLLKMIEDEEG